ncbi:MAG: hypothetical protein HQL50_00535 [Magnetococcales bacterium]|nr:hypothetical protein [Magnetococcales bacterium]
MRKLFGDVLSMILIVAALLVPYLAYRAQSAHARLSLLEAQHRQLQRDYAQINPRQQQMKIARHYLNRTDSFTRRAQAAGISPKAWDRHLVTFKDRQVPFRELGWLSANTRPGKNYYFIPKVLDIRAPNSEDWKVKEVTDRGIKNLQHVLVSLEGEYWVRNPVADMGAQVSLRGDSP